MARRVYSVSIAVAFRQHDLRGSLETAELASSRAFLDLLAARQGAADGGTAGLTFRGSPSVPDVASPLTTTPVGSIRRGPS